MKTVEYEIVVWELKVCGTIPISIIDSIVDYEMGRGHLFGIPHWMITCLLGGMWYDCPEKASQFSTNLLDSQSNLEQYTVPTRYAMPSFSPMMARVSQCSGEFHNYVKFPDFVPPLSLYFD